MVSFMLIVVHTCVGICESEVSFYSWVEWFMYMHVLLWLLWAEIFTSTGCSPTIHTFCVYGEMINWNHKWDWWTAHACKHYGLFMSHHCCDGMIWMDSLAVEVTALPFTHFVTWFAYQEWSRTVLVQHNLHYFSIQGQSNRSAVTLCLIGDLEKGLGNFIT